MDVTAALLDSWDRQCQIVSSVASEVTEANRKAKPSPESWSLDHHLAHMQKVRQFWLSRVAPERAAALGELFTDGWDTPIDDLDTIKRELEKSGPAVREAVRDRLANGTVEVGGYDNPVLFLQHMLWHDGWHVGLIMLGLRGAGCEKPESWEIPNIWGRWVTE